ncbi:MAG: transposase [Planctomycetota bacterium]
MRLWIAWFGAVLELREACSRKRTFLWICLVLVGFCIRGHLLGVTSFVRACFLLPATYPCLLHLFHTSALNLEALTPLWIRLTLKCFAPVVFRNYLVCIADGLKVPKEGRKMPAVKALHQESHDNSKPEFIMGHSFQIVGLLAKSLLGGLFCVPLASRIHEGLVWSNRDQRTLLDKLVTLFLAITEWLDRKVMLLADADYASQKVIRPLLRQGHHLTTRVRTTTVAFEPAPKPKEPRRGRQRLYGNKIRLRGLWSLSQDFIEANSPVYGESDLQIRYLSVKLLWQPVGKLVRFVLVDHSTRGRIILMTTLVSLEPLEVIELYGCRFKIEVSFKQALHTLGTYAYHFWMKYMLPIRRGSGDQYLHRASEKYREMVKNKMAAYHRYVQLGCIAQGLLQYLSVKFASRVCKHFNSWMRTMDPDQAPSEMVVAQALRSSLPDFLATTHGKHELEKFIVDNADLSRMPNLRLTG